MGPLDRLFGRMTPERFAEKMIEVLRQVGIEGPIEFDAEEFMLTFDDHRMYLGNVWDEYQAAPKNMKQQVLEHFAWGLVAESEMPETFDEARDMLMPVVKGRAAHETMRLRGMIEGELGMAFPAEVFAEHFIATVAVDLPNRIMYMSQEQLDEWGVTLDEAMEVALENLGGRGIELAGAQGSTYMSTSQDSYDATRVLLTDRFRRLQVRGRHVVALPNRDTLVITGSNDPQGLEMMAGIIEEAAQQPRFESGIALVLEDEGWTPFMPPEGSPAYAALRKQFLGSLWRDCDEQKELLDRLHEQEGTDIFVAEYSVYEHQQTGSLSTMAVWTEGADTLLPQVERVGFVTGAPEDPQVLGMAEWDRVAEIAGELMEPTDYYPPRWRLRQFPSQEQLDAMDLDSNLPGNP